MNLLKSKIIEKKMLTHDNIRLVLENKEIAGKSYPGVFVNVRCCHSDELILRRPISVLDAYEDRYEIVFKVMGKGTERLAYFETGDLLDVLGPLGKGFTFSQNYRKVAFIGGGIGIFPVVYAAKQFHGCQKDFFAGFKTKEEIMLMESLKQHVDHLYLSTDDGSEGYPGFITDLFMEKMTDYDMVYICGPAVMEEKIVKTLRKNKIKGQVSLEERMGCGIGACLVCACKTSHGIRHVCKDGPVFDIEDVFIEDEK
ncbi:MAG: dihydroorotate dehydrogenase electron transfer subunit [Clostridia bacterium]|nr:dihydroorotate dehydrogenase electron transfer subunit [Clostridia bacterium]